MVRGMLGVGSDRLGAGTVGHCGMQAFTQEVKESIVEYVGSEFRKRKQMGRFSAVGDFSVDSLCDGSQQHVT
jgi:hypothetical protein